MQHCDVLIAIVARFDDRVIGNHKHFGSVPRNARRTLKFADSATDTNGRKYGRLQQPGAASNPLEPGALHDAGRTSQPV
jgi:thiamine pyrophosphate-dependent acetolactate synthase large subunit-like protein